MMNRRNSRIFVLSLIAGATVFSGCKPERAVDVSGELSKVTADLESTRLRLATTEKELEEQKSTLEKLKSDADSARQIIADKELAITKQTEQLRGVQAEFDALRRGEAMAFADIAGVEQKGLSGTALERYKKFVIDFPQSPLVPAANRAIAELTPKATQDAKFRTTMTDPRRDEREVVKRFGDGLVTIDEIAPLIRGKTSAEVIKLLGPPSSSFRNGSELGYANRVIDTSSGGKETLVITFDAKGVVSLRLGYRGREIRP